MGGRAFVWVVAAAAACMMAQNAGAQARDARVGAWVERKVSSSYQGLRRSFEDLGGGMIRVNIAVDANGAALSSVDLRCDDRPYPVVGQDRQPTGLSLSCRALGPGVTAFTFTRASADSWTTSAGTESVSQDGETMTVSAVQTDPQGRVVNRIERQFARKPKL